jgi:uncharacterized protein YndB with AHSA1/START domain
MIRRQMIVPTDTGRLWRALTDPDELGAWFGGRFHWTPTEGEPLRFTPAPESGDQAREGRVESVQPGRELRFTWWPVEGGSGEADRDGDGGPSEVAWRLEPVGPATILTVEETPTPAPAPALASASIGAGSAGRWEAGDDLALALWAERHVGAWAVAGTRAGAIAR